ncbi:hypothetical protein FJZ33_10965, partial [Candidatus Poribacteria bacterium]|nr:hypothetical protein [Candidatus Poribacteria bacterium]
MAKEESIIDAFQKGRTLAIADQILIESEQGKLVPRTEKLMEAIRIYGKSPEHICEALLRLGMNFAGRDAEILGYKPDEIESAFNIVLSAIDSLGKDTMKKVVNKFLEEMKSVNLKSGKLCNSLPGLLAERIEPIMDMNNP